jgi:hypothetical protein
MPRAEPPAPPSGGAGAEVWHLLSTDAGKEYYYNRARKVTQWEKPKAGYIIDLREGKAPASGAPVKPRATAHADALSHADERIKSRQVQSLSPSAKATSSTASSAATSAATSASPSASASASASASTSSRAASKSGAASATSSTSSASGAERRDPGSPKRVSTPAEAIANTIVSPKRVSTPAEAVAGALAAVAVSSPKASVRKSPGVAAAGTSPPQPAAPSPDRAARARGSSGGSSGPRARAPRRRNSLPRTWEKKMTATFGRSDESECFYVNIVTGETQWSRPAEYESEDERDRRVDESAICFDKSAAVVSVLAELGCVPANDMTTDREAMLKGGAEDAVKRCEKRLRQLNLAVRYCGTASEWERAMSAKDFALVREVYLHWGKQGRTPPKVRAEACVLMHSFAQLDPSLIRRYAIGAWGQGPIDFLANLEQGLQEASPDEPSLFSWLSLMYSFLSEVHTLPPATLPSQDTIEVLIAALSAADEDLFLMAAYVLLALNTHLGLSAAARTAGGGAAEEEDRDLRATLGDEPNSLLCALLADRRGLELFSEAVMHLLNGQSYPYSDAVLLRQLLIFLQASFATRATNELFHTNDVRVLLDIILQSIRDLQPSDNFRTEYLRVLHLVLVNSPAWAKDKFRRREIVLALDEVCAAANKGMLKAAAKYASRILLDCVKQLQ